MFDRIAAKYDLLNRVLSCGIDRLWRRRLARTLLSGTHHRILDLATGTGDVALTIASKAKRAFIVGVDPSAAMLAAGHDKIRQARHDNAIALAQGDAMALSFDDDIFDAVTIAFGIRNVPDVPQALREILRVTKPGGRLLILEFSLPTNPLLRSAYLLYFRHVLPRIGGAVSGDKEAYRYLNRSAEAFPAGSAMCSLIEAAGFAQPEAYPLTWGVATLYTATKPTRGEG